MSEPAPELTAEDLRRLVRTLDLVPIPEALVPRVLANVRTYRASMRRLAEAGIDLSRVVTAQPFRARDQAAAGERDEALAPAPASGRSPAPTGELDQGSAGDQAPATAGESEREGPL